MAPCAWRVECWRRGVRRATLLQSIGGTPLWWLVGICLRRRESWRGPSFAMIAIVSNNIFCIFAVEP